MVKTAHQGLRAFHRMLEKKAFPVFFNDFVLLSDPNLSSVRPVVRERGGRAKIQADSPAGEAIRPPEEIAWLAAIVDARQRGQRAFPAEQSRDYTEGAERRRETASSTSPGQHSGRFRFQLRP